MDFDIGNILYIVITLVAVTIGLLGKKKKPAVPGTGEVAKPGFLENLERAFNMEQQNRVVTDFEDDEEYKPVEDEVFEPVIAPISTTTSMMEEYERLLAERMTNVNLDVTYAESGILTEPLEVIQIDEEEGTNFFDAINDFNAGTAIVYSAIINRIDY